MSKDEFGFWTIKTELPVSFSIKITTGLFDIENDQVLEFGSTEKEVEE